MDELSISDDLLLITVEAGVRLALLDMRVRGVVVDESMLAQAKERFSGIREMPCASESILFRIDNKTGTNTAILIESIAIMAHMPGGVTFGNTHFEVERKNHARSDMDHG